MALVAAALAAYLAFNVVRDRGPVVVQATEAPTAHVVVAAHDMDVGHTLTAERRPAVVFRSSFPKASGR
jgi:Flp pilus assembly protein CpaB